jgi:sulfate adenylyltransferase subunit 1 (EFTu-like GTPase family)
MSDKMREEFEEWIAQVHDGVKYARGLERVLSGERYASMEVEWAYRGYVQSRAALCVELPEWEQYDDNMVSGAATAINDCQDAIHAAGVKTK